MFQAWLLYLQHIPNGQTQDGQTLLLYLTRGDFEKTMGSMRLPDGFSVAAETQTLTGCYGIAIWP